MKSSVPARSVIGAAALLAGLVPVGLLSGCEVGGDPDLALDVTATSAAPEQSPPAGTAAAKGQQLDAVATVRAWIASRNEALATGGVSLADALGGGACRRCDRHLDEGRWTVESVRVTRLGAESATVNVRVGVAGGGEREQRTLTFEVARVSGGSMVTKVVARS